ncbi:YihY/virulence factor BrkB family protein [Pseudonocardia alaniniphila]|uniref:YihY/virulence factor BrkB family protein n=1 Tax=Pseudonocardia alaniniphila TaxID=75291 RepID=A0ABS9TA17_9PSEU|nr:YihY/virulence factor BrkB family protein [Pseudonocardia alaniniphila]MCH6165384.1 YihY/virulence factor BrkB family protein [Pseudonocardia alaniniphila]
MIRRIDGYQRRHRWLGVPLAVVYKFVDDQGSYLAALITYYGFLSLFPLLLVMSTVLGFVLPGNPGLQQQLIHSALSQFPIIGDQLTSTAQPLRGSGFGLAIGIVVSLYGGLGVAVAVQNALNHVWGVPINKRPDPFHARLRSLLMLVLLGLGVLVTTVLSALAAGAGAVGEELGVGLRLLAIVVSVAAMCGLFVLGFRAMTVRDVSAREVLPGALLSALAWQVLQSTGAFFVSHGLMGSTQVYGLFGIVLGLLAWIYIEAVIIVLAAELNAVLGRRLYPRSLLTPFVEDVELTRADRRSYTSYASTQQFKEQQTINVQFEPRRETAQPPITESEG